MKHSGQISKFLLGVVAALAIAGAALCIDLGATGAVKGAGKDKKTIEKFEKVSAPTAPSGPANGETGTTLTYNVTGISSDLGHAVECRFDWGDGNHSSWSTSTSASHSWSSAGTYLVRVQVRCKQHTGVVGWSATLSVSISVPETVSIPSTPSGPSGGQPAQSYTYSTGGSTSNLGHPVQYRFDWGDGTYSTWGTGTSASRSWTVAGTYLVKAQARCGTHTGAVSGWSGNLTVSIAAETVSAPSVPAGPAMGAPSISYAYTTGGSTSGLGHPVEYRFDWGDGGYSTWSSGTSASHSWSTMDTYPVSAEARCQTHPTVTAVSSAASVVIVAETVGAPSVPSGSAGGILGTSYTYSTGGSTSNLSHPVEYRFDWGNGTYSTWGTGTSASQAWTAGGTYQVKAEARCQTHPTVTAVSSALSVGIFAPLAVGGTTADMVLITAGGFNMGDASYATPIHAVHLDAFYIDKYEVTFDQYDAFCTATSRTAAFDSGFGRGTRPVINITWYDAEAYCTWAGKRMPTEAEWEGACRAGTDTAWSWGDNSALAGTYAWDWDNSPSGTQPVGGKTANPFGLYDMHGNVMEWVADWYDSGYYSVSPLNNPPGPASGTYRVLRGGSWGHSYAYLRSGLRCNIGIMGVGPTHHGCRCAKTP